MQSVIGAYSSSEGARQAIQRLEQKGFTQGLAIADTSQAVWRKLRGGRDDGGAQRFMVVMAGKRATIARARELLHQPDAPSGRELSSWHALTSEHATQRAGSDPRTGLSQAEVTRRGESFGPNAMPLPPTRSVPRLVLHQFQSPLIYLLFGAAAVALAFGRGRDAAVIVSVLSLNAFIGAFQEFRAERSLKALSRITSHKVQVLREGLASTIEASQVVPGDILLLQAGDAVGADARVLEGVALRTGEAALTGESASVSKSSAVMSEDTVVAARQNMVYAGTHVTAGRARALVIDTGVATQMGRIAHLTRAARSPATPLEVRIQRLGRQVMWVALILFGLVVGLGLLRAMAFVDVAMIGLSQVVGIVPEGLPVAMTIALAVGVQRMARRGAVVRDIAAVETLGSTTVVCTDKTGTLTRNEMTVAAVALPSGRQLRVSGLGYAPRGEFFEGAEQIDPRGDPALRELLEAAALCSDAELLEPKAAECPWLIVGDPTEAALLTVAGKAGVDLPALRASWQRHAEVPFEASTRSMAVQVHRGNERRILIKGAPEVVLNLCGRVRASQGTHPLDEGTLRELERLGNDLELGALRLLAVAVVEDEALEPHADLAQLRGRAILLGVLGQLDPPRPEARAAVESCREAGIRTVMITGDHAATGVAVARSVGVFREHDRAMDGAELERLSTAQLAACVDQVSVYSRVHPAQKLRIVEALQRRGEVVAMTGDGVNDAPALARADVGVAMGLSGTEVAREAAKVVLTDDNFATLRGAVEEGRVIYRNLRKVLLLLLSTSAAEVVVLVAALALGYPPPFTAVQILWINLVSEGLITVNLVMEPKEGNEMQVRPVPKRSPLLDRTMLVRASCMLTTIVTVTLGWFVWRTAQGSSLAQLQTETFTMMVLCAWFNAFNCRFETRSALRAAPGRNPWLLIGIATGVVAQALVIFFRPLGEQFGTVPLDARTALTMLGVASCVLWTEELRKLASRSARSHRLRRPATSAPG